MPFQEDHRINCPLLEHAVGLDQQLKTHLSVAWDEIEIQLNNTGKAKSKKALFNHPVLQNDQELKVKRCQSPHCIDCHAAAWVLLFKHFIECRWPACYNTTSDEVIAAHFCSRSLLHAMLRSSMIRDTRDILHGHEGARVFPELLFHLGKIQDPSVQAYLTSLRLRD